MNSGYHGYKGAPPGLPPRRAPTPSATPEPTIPISTPTLTPTPNPPLATNCTPPASLPEVSGSAALVTIADVTLRTGPGTACDQRAVIPGDSAVTAVSGPVQADDLLWVLVDVDGQEGWTAWEFLEPIGDSIDPAHDVTPRMVPTSAALPEHLNPVIPGNGVPVLLADNEAAAEATISALQTQVAELETQVTSTEPPATPTPMATPGLDAAQDSRVGGTALALHAPGDADDLSIVALGPYDGTFPPVILRNSTDIAVRQVRISAIARDADGTLLASGEDVLGTLPHVVLPGGVTFGAISFQRVDLPADAIFSLDLTAREVVMIDSTVFGTSKWLRSHGLKIGSTGYWSIRMRDAAKTAYRTGMELGDGEAAFNLGVLLKEDGEREGAEHAFGIARDLGFDDSKDNSTSLPALDPD